MEHTRPTIMEVDLSKIRHNILQFQSIACAPLLAVVKANGYGHGAVEVAREAKKAGVSHFGVATVGEGVDLRNQGIQDPIIVLGGLLPEEVPDCHRYDLQVTIGSIEFLEALAPISCAFDRPLLVHLKIDTGMHRLGILPTEVHRFIQVFRNSKNLVLQGLATHFADAAADMAYSTEQLHQFHACVQSIESALGPVPYRHAANSAAVINLPLAHFNLVRVGLGLYGYHDHPELEAKLLLKPAASLKTRITSLRRLTAGEKIGYGGTYVTTGDCTVATIPIGYADGYPRSLSNKGFVIVSGKKAPVLGRVCMDQCMVDVTGIDGVQEGSEVILIGRQQGGEVSLYQLTFLAETIPHEILTTLGMRIPRTYHNL